MKTSAGLVVAFFVSFAACGQGSPPEAAPDPVPAVASNQSVSLSEAATDGNKPAASSGGSVPSSLSSETSTETGRTVRRGRTTHVLSSEDAAGPWYRSAVGATLLVVGAIVVLFLAIRRFLPTAVASDQAMLNVVARAALGPRHSVALIQMPRRYLLVGVGPESVSVLTEISDAEEAADLTAVVLGGKGGRRRFEEVLAREEGGFAAGLGEPAASHASKTKRAGSPAALAELLRRIRGLEAKVPGAHAPG